MRITYWGLQLEVEDQPISVDLENKVAVYRIIDGELHGAKWQGSTVALPLVSRACSNPETVQ
jgi:hypothetical protein